MGRYYQHARQVMLDHGGTLEKFIGDAVMAVFGLPQAHGNDAERALAAALALRAAVTGDALLAGRLLLRMGVNTGEVVATSDTSAGDFLVTGDAVNVAARLQQAATPGEILVGERTKAAGNVAFRFGEAHTIEVKGKSQPLPSSRCSASVPPAPCSRPPLVGRRRELAQLGLLCEAVLEERHPQLVSIVAPAGTGKTRLLEEFLAGLDPAHGWQVATARCLTLRANAHLLAAARPPRRAAGRALFARARGGGVHRGGARRGGRRATRGVPVGCAGRRAGRTDPAREYLQRLAAVHRGAGAAGAPDRRLRGSALGQREPARSGRARHPPPHPCTAPDPGAEPAGVAGPPPLLGRWTPELHRAGPRRLSEAQTRELIDPLVPELASVAVRARIVERSGGNPFFAIELAHGLAERLTGAADAASAGADAAAGYRLRGGAGAAGSARGA